MLKKYLLIALLYSTVPALAMDQTFKIYGSEGAASAFEVSAEVLQLSSTLTGLIEDLGGSTESAIPISNFSTQTLKNLVDILNMYDGSPESLEQVREKAESYSPADLIDIVNCAHYLGISEIILNVFKNVIIVTKKFKSSCEIAAGELNADFTGHDMRSEIMSQIIRYIKIKSLDINAQERVHILKASVNNAKTYSLAGIFFNNDSLIAFSTTTGKKNQDNVLIFDAVQHKQLYTLPLDFHANQLIAYKNSYLVCREFQGHRIRIFNIQDPHNIRHYDYVLPGRLIKSMQLSSEGNFLVLTNNRKKIVVIDMNALDWTSMPVSFDIAKTLFLDAPVGYSSQDKIFFSDDSNCMIASMKPTVINVSRVNCIDGAVTYVAIPQRKAHFRCCGFSSDGKRLAVLSDLGKKLKISIFNPEDMREIIAVDGPNVGKSDPLSVQFSPDGLWLMCTKHNSVSFYNSTTGEPLRKIKGLAYNKSVCMSSDSSKLLMAGSDSLMTENYFSIIYTLLTDEEKLTLEKISNCSFKQLQLIRDLCYTLMTNNSVEINKNSASYTLFNSLDNDIQQLLRKIGVKIITPIKLKKLLSRSKKG